MTFFYVQRPRALHSYGISDGDAVTVESRRGAIQVFAAFDEIERGQVFIPFHFGTFDSKDGRARGANELTLNNVDPCVFFSNKMG